MQRNVRRTVVILLCVIVVFVGAAVSRILRSPDVSLSPEEMQQLGVFVKTEPKELKPFALMDHQRQLFDGKRLQGQWSLIFLGYTSCPDVCPTTLALFKQLRASWQDSELADQVQYVLLTADPERDTVARLAGYMNYFNDEFIGVTGSVESIYRVTLELDSIFAKVPVNDGTDYLMDHSANIVIINPAGRYHGFFRAPHDLAKMKTAMEAVVAAY